MQVAVQSHKKWTFFRLLCTCKKFSSIFWQTDKLHFESSEGTPYDSLYWDPSPDRGVFFRLQMHERVGISLVEVYKRVEKYVIWTSKRGTKRLTDEFVALKSRENVPFLWLIYIYRTLKGMESCNQGMWKGYHLLMEGVRKGSLPYKHLFSTPSLPGPRLWVNVAKIIIKSDLKTVITKICLETTKSNLTFVSYCELQRPEVSFNCGVQRQQPLKTTYDDLFKYILSQWN